MTLVKPFRALRPAPGRAAEILAPPYDVLSSAEAAAHAAERPWSFLHISRPEIDLEAGVDPHDERVYATAAGNLGRMIAAGVLMRDARPCYYAYRLSGHGRAQTGLAAIASLADYASNRIRKHELTTPLKEDDRVRQVTVLNAQTGPVMLAYPAAAALDALLARASAGAPAVDVVADDGVRHQMWVIGETEAIESLTRTVDALPALYIADGHHRSAAAARVARARAAPGADAAHDYFLAVLFPHHEMTILDYSRVLRDLNGHTPDTLLAALRARMAVEAIDRAAKPTSGGEFALCLGGRWYRLTLPRAAVPADDPIARLPMTLLTRHVIEPIFGVTDPRTDKRIDFVGGGRGLEELERLVVSGEMAAALALYPTAMADVMAVADAGGIMPPKSTWFVPKLADGMVSHLLD
ncbi:MAG: DUF1015 domain-containing protein [Proteobacteria bacterium]|nr:DUF1015 domain-containing protein [Pseudomonadota bacterium]